jgi:hypothetical protein
MWNMLAEKRAILDVGGFPADDRKQDCALLHKLITKKWVHGEGNTPGNPQCIHRLVATAYAHAIDFRGWKSAADNQASSDHMAAQVASRMDAGEEPRGQVGINPMWRHDYEAITEAAWFAPDQSRSHPRIGET